MKAVFACCNPTLEIYRNCGKLLKSSAPEICAKTAPFLKAVDDSGFELTTGGTILPETKEQLEIPLMTVPEYVRYIGM